MVAFANHAIAPRDLHCDVTRDAMRAATPDDFQPCCVASACDFRLSVTRAPGRRRRCARGYAAPRRRSSHWPCRTSPPPHWAAAPALRTGPGLGQQVAPFHVSQSDDALILKSPEGILMNKVLSGFGGLNSPFSNCSASPPCFVCCCPPHKYPKLSAHGSPVFKAPSIDVCSIRAATTRPS